MDGIDHGREFAAGDFATTPILQVSHHLNGPQLMLLCFVSDQDLPLPSDVTFGNRIGRFPSQAQVSFVWRVAKWLKTYAEPLRVKDLIWQRRI